MFKAAAAVAVVALAAWAGVQQHQIREARQLAADAQSLADDVGWRATAAKTTANSAYDIAKQAEEDNVSDADITGALTYCLRDDQAMRLGGMEDCIDWWFEEYAQGDF